MFENEKPNDAAADEARAKAEARRRRILEKSNQRMGVVSGGDPAVKVTEEECEPSTASSSSSRMQAMRRRRYKKSSQQSKEEPQKVSAEEEEAKEESKSPDMIAREGVETATTATKDGESVEKTAPTTEKRKYKGVAAMRRQRLKEKAAASAEENKEQVAAKVAAKSRTLTVKKFPIILHICIIIFLFSIGFKVGLDQVVDESITVQSTLLAPQEHGIGLLSIFGEGWKKSKPQKKLLDDESGWSNEDSADEFVQDNESDEEEYESNLDPLFQVDLDLYTQGDSIFMMLARFAVSLHRLLLKVVYYTPIAIVTAFIRMPGKLLETPPILCLVSVGVRQFGKRVLGAGLPEESKETNKQDIMAMVKNGVMNFLSSSFPTLVGVYDAFTHLRSDIFIVLSGLFVGLAW
eukprot:CAMPEP_0178911114 /NCGR_PEP_ID=MMETSP0786-20121207/9498_1 /TAXON_ID=186022 /ORGANISM="Thalassionema frauenfeldii, Strain CCMP 1798" /LENGTH=405 /DNA_ID=CAMNT_0020583491 /DNA_START=167 /DNA_END=1381 /DNA_ORIENTATION=-